MNLGTVKKTQCVLVQGWESWVRTLKRGHRQDVADTARVGLLIMVALDELQGTIFEHADRLQNYAHTHGAKCTTPAPSTWEYAGEDNDQRRKTQYIGALRRDCYRCGGLGHTANACSTPQAEGKGREDKCVAKGCWAGPAARDGRDARDGMKRKELVRKAIGKGSEDMRSTQNSFFEQAPTRWKHATTWTKTQALLFFFFSVECVRCM